MRPAPLSRRELLTGRSSVHPPRLCPPGASLESLRNCTGCGLCAERCPTGIIRLVGGLPSVDFSAGECTFCAACQESCPEAVFDEKPASRFPHTALIGDGCLPMSNIACQSCGESCPVQAIRFRPRMGGPFLPDLDDMLCTGCGACLQVCPVNAISMRPLAQEAAHG
ncbi:ferredoxin-type protein NapF [Rhizobium sp. LC145]|uniref:ferredoxin-type protein NapF n=1 Tax=Rhizobium sp. LC145 TaxID=1120688 RepID=UPI0009E4AF6C|nr:ferredoxin-type protein NapF [Rhizobium sp. LC145]TKT68648.1 ferredoxin-type protein NapF [Rhizobiaceae bacterium LC148]